MTSFEHGGRCGDVLERTIALLEAENSALQGGRSGQVAELQPRKAMALFELERLTRSDAVRFPNFAERLHHAREVLELNRTLLKLNVSALIEVMNVLRASDLNDGFDGTYSSQSLLGGGSR